MDVDKFSKELKQIDNIDLLTEKNFMTIIENIKENIKRTQEN